MTVSPLSASVVLATIALAIAGCGGDDKGNSSPSPSSSPEAAETTSGTETAGATPASILACLKQAGLDAKDQSSSTGEKIGIDFPEGRAVISFEDSAEDAETYASVAETNGELVKLEGSIVSSIPAGGAAEAQQATIEGCLTG